MSVRKTSQRLGIRTDSSMRFEKGVDTQAPHRAQYRYEQLLKYFVPHANKKEVTIFTRSIPLIQITVPHDILAQKIGTHIESEQVTDILHRLGFDATVKKENYIVTVPSWRATGDVDIVPDIVEEVARHI